MAVVLLFLRLNHWFCLHLRPKDSSGPVRENHNGNRSGCFQKYGCLPPKSSILIGFSIVNHPFWGKTPYFWKHPETPISVATEVQRLTSRFPLHADLTGPVVLAAQARIKTQESWIERLISVLSRYTNSTDICWVEFHDISSLRHFCMAFKWCPLEKKTKKTASLWAGIESFDFSKVSTTLANPFSFSFGSSFLRNLHVSLGDESYGEPWNGSFEASNAGICSTPQSPAHEPGGATMSV